MSDIGPAFPPALTTSQPHNYYRVVNTASVGNQQRISGFSRSLVEISNVPLQPTSFLQRQYWPSAPVLSNLSNNNLAPPPLTPDLQAGHRFLSATAGSGQPPARSATPLQRLLPPLPASFTLPQLSSNTLTPGRAGQLTRHAGNSAIQPAQVETRLAPVAILAGKRFNGAESLIPLSDLGKALRVMLECSSFTMENFLVLFTYMAGRESIANSEIPAYQFLPANLADWFSVINPQQYNRLAQAMIQLGRVAGNAKDPQFKDQVARFVADFRSYGGDKLLSERTFFATNSLIHGGTDSGLQKPGWLLNDFYARQSKSGQTAEKLPDDAMAATRKTLRTIELWTEQPVVTQRLPLRICLSELEKNLINQRVERYVAAANMQNSYEVCYEDINVDGHTVTQLSIKSWDTEFKPLSKMEDYSLKQRWQFAKGMLTFVKEIAENKTFCGEPLNKLRYLPGDFLEKNDATGQVRLSMTGFLLNCLSAENPDIDKFVYDRIETGVAPEVLKQITGNSRSSNTDSAYIYSAGYITNHALQLNELYEKSLINTPQEKEAALVLANAMSRTLARRATAAQLFNAIQQLAPLMQQQIKQEEKQHHQAVPLLAYQSGNSVGVMAGERFIGVDRPSLIPVADRHQALRTMLENSGFEQHHLLAPVLYMLNNTIPAAGFLPENVTSWFGTIQPQQYEKWCQAFIQLGREVADSRNQDYKNEVAAFISELSKQDRAAALLPPAVLAACVDLIEGRTGDLQLMAATISDFYTQNIGSVRRAQPANDDSLAATRETLRDMLHEKADSTQRIYLDTALSQEDKAKITAIVRSYILSTAESESSYAVQCYDTTVGNRDITRLVIKTWSSNFKPLRKMEGGSLQKRWAFAKSLLTFATRIEQENNIYGQPLTNLRHPYSQFMLFNAEKGEMQFSLAGLLLNCLSAENAAVDKYLAQSDDVLMAREVREQIEKRRTGNQVDNSYVYSVAQAIEMSLHLTYLDRRNVLPGAEWHKVNQRLNEIGNGFFTKRGKVADMLAAFAVLEPFMQQQIALEQQNQPSDFLTALDYGIKKEHYSLFD
ncbi:hypothetical protein [Pantoea sp. B65]|uniref:hypothetical protein n=1 Tax=Pantoea sp. B65 TaxID=2813359 RepID=UPI0039B664CC